MEIDGFKSSSQYMFSHSPSEMSWVNSQN